MTNATDTSLSYLIYTRVSTPEQGLESGLGLEAQEAACRAYITAHGHQIAGVITEIDSAVDGDQPLLTDALQRCLDGEADGVVAARGDRLSRSVTQTAALLDWSERHGVEIAAVDLNLDTASPSGRMVAQILGSVAEHEARLISERTKAALRAKRARGESISRPAVDADAADLIHELKAAGFSYRGICAELNRRGVPTARGGSEWRISAIQRTLGYQRPRRRKSTRLPERAKRAAAAA